MFKAKQSDPDWLCLHFTSFDNPYIPREALDAVARDMSLDSYRRELLAEDDEIEQSWLVYGCFNERVCKIKRFDILKSWFIYSGHDFGKANPAALFVAQDPGTGNFYIFREYLPGGGRSAYEHTEEFKSLSEGYNILKRVGGNPNSEDEIRQAYTAQGWPIVAPKITRANAQIDRVIGLMRLNKLFIFEDLHGLLGELSSCMWELDKEGRITDKIKNESRYHLLSCLRYIGSDFVPETAQQGSVVLAGRR